MIILYRLRKNKFDTENDYLYHHQYVYFCVFSIDDQYLFFMILFVHEHGI